MKKFIALLAFIVLPSTEAQVFCSPRQAATIGTFLKKLVTEREYYGNETETETFDGEMSTVDKVGSYFFIRAGRLLKVEKEFCTSSECQSGSESWGFKGNCFRVGSRYPRIIRARTNELLFELAYPGPVTVTNHLILNSKNQLSYSVFLMGAEGSLSSQFFGD